MPKGLTIAQVIDKNMIASDRVWLFALKVYVTDANGSAIEQLRLVRNNEAVTLSGEVYDPMPFQIEKKDSAGEIGNIAITIQDQQRLLQARLQQYQGAVNFEVDVSVTMLESGSIVGTLDTDLVERYKIMNTSSSEYAVTFELGAENPLRFMVPKRKQSKDRCTFVYKGIECGYAGGITSCDYTLDGANGCTVHANQERYGAYPGLSIRT